MSIEDGYYWNCDFGNIILGIDGEVTGFWLNHENGVYKFALANKERLYQLNLFAMHIDVPIRQLLQKVGPKVLQAVSKFHSRQCEIFRFCLGGGQLAIDLVSDCPALSYLVARHILRNGQGPENLYEDILDILTVKRQKMLSEIQWPHEKWILKLLSKIPASECCDDLFLQLRKILESGNGNSDKIKVLRHISALDNHIVKLLSDDDIYPYLTNSFFKEIDNANATENDFLFDEWEWLFDLKKEILDAISKGFRISPLKSLSDLSDLHDSLIEWLSNIDYRDEIKDIIFPLSPFPKTVIQKKNDEEFGIFPIENGNDLWREGDEMQHCISGYAHHIVESNGWTYAYHVKLPYQPPATVMITSNGSEGWFVKEIKGKHNQVVSPYVVRWVVDWLKNQAAGHLYNM